MQKCTVTHSECVIVGLCTDNKKKLIPLEPLCLQMLWIWNPTEKNNKENKANRLLPPTVRLFLFPSLTCLDQPKLLHSGA